MNRRKFIRQSSLSVFALSTFGFIFKDADGSFTGDCATTNDILGPFYRPKAPFRSDLTFEGLKGTRILLKGRVFKADCTTPLKDALVEIWHCDTEGVYDNESTAFRHRARLKTDAQGEYSFQTILPGKYLNGRLYRPAHIHFRVTEANSKALISQIYFKGDPHVTEDPWASQDKAQWRILELLPEDTQGGLSVYFDIYLQDKH